MLIALFALIALGAVLVFDGTTEEAAGERPATLQDASPEPGPPALISAARAKLRLQRDRNAGHAPTVVTDLEDHRRADNLLVLQYDARRPRPKLALEHDETAGVSQLYADGRLVLRVHNAPGEEKLTLDEIVMDGAPRS